MTGVPAAQAAMQLATDLRVITADLNGYLERRAGELAEPLIAAAREEAAERVREATAEVTRQRDLVAELRRQLAMADRQRGRRNCLFLGCRESYNALEIGGVKRGWYRSNALGGVCCPEHAASLGWGEGPTLHDPQWDYTCGNVLHCSCGWASGPVGHLATGVELWVDHAYNALSGEGETR